MRILFLLIVLSVTSALQSQVVIKENAIQSKYAFPLVTSKAKAVVVYAVSYTHLTLPTNREV